MKFIKNLLLLLLLVLLASFFRDRMLMTTFATRSANMSEVYTLSSMSVLAIDVLLLLFVIWSKPSFSKWSKKVLYLLIYLLIISLLFNTGSRLSYLLAFLPILSFLGFRAIISMVDEKLFFYLYVPFSFFVAFSFFESHTLLQFIAEDNFVMNTVFSVIYLLPLILCLNGKIVGKLSLFKWLYLALIVISILYSGKRSPFISVFAALAVYYYIIKIKFEKSQVTKSLLLVGTVLVGYLGLQYILFQSDFYLVERLSSMQQDHGSGRTEVWAMAWKVICQSDFLPLIIGHGTDSLCVAPGNNLGYPAHNDFLECIYDYGIIGFCLYLSLHIALIKKTLSLIHIKSYFAAPMAMSYVIFLVSSMVSHILIYEYYLMVFCMFWAYVDVVRSREVNKFN